MKIERSCWPKVGAAVTWRGFRRIVCSLFLIAAVVAAVGAVASPRANQGGSTSLKAMANPAEDAKVSNATPGNIIIVTNTSDSGPGSLRDALAVANDGDTIDATGVSGTILLTNGELQITHNVTINGPGAGSLAVNGNGSSRVFANFAPDVTISGFTITNGLSDGGGGILNQRAGTCCAGLTVTNSSISGNSADYGGGILNSSHDSVASLTVSNSTISGNSADYGGGICNGHSGIGGSGVTISNSTVSGNLADVDGGGVYNSGSQGEPAGLSIKNSTISGNSATGNGGGIYHRGSGPFGTATFEIGSTILNAGASGGTIFNDGGTVASLGYNLANDAGGGVLTGPGDQINTIPLLGPLQDNGGPTFTQALLPGSPAINAGDSSFTPPPFFDQRGPSFYRVRDGRIDIGSFEVQAGSTPTPTPRPSPTPRPRPTPAPRS